MATITYRTDEKTKERLAKFAESQNVSINRAIDIMVNNTISEREAFYQFQERAKDGDPEKALKLLHSRSCK
ncbi:hypothetical protein [Glaciecola sp. 1036]|uniref:hypothetical protein n=1 Tax=Alteromonadaceae TaxID=72275 RepID=UPI003CFC2BC8